jgi:hypothetical protein
MENTESDLYRLLSEHCYNKYKTIVDKTNNNGGNYSIIFRHLSKIDNIQVISTLKIPCSSHCSHMVFETRDKLPPYKNLYTYTCAFDVESNNKEFGQDDICHMLKSIFQVVTTLKFDKVSGSLQEYIEPFGNQFVDGKECSVCYELTMTKTVICDHPICRYCFQHLRQKFVCPICRTKTRIDEDSDANQESDSDSE